MNNPRIQFGLTLLLQLLAGASVLLISTRNWQSVVTLRDGRTADLLRLTGRTIDDAPTALALVALAGVVAVLATSGWVRRIFGLVIAASGGALAWRAFLDRSPIGTARARSLVLERHPYAGTSTAQPQVSSSVGWALLSASCGLLVVVAGLLIAWRGHRWSVMSVRYDAPPSGPVQPAQIVAEPVDSEQVRVRAEAALWTALDRGEDPTQLT